MAKAKHIQCSEQEFYDEVTRRCAPCFDICMNKILQRTAEECDDKCSHFSITSTTTEGVNKSEDEDPNKYVALLIVCIALAIVVACLLLYVIVKREWFAKAISDLCRDYCGMVRENVERQPEQSVDNGCSSQMVTSVNQASPSYIQEEETPNNAINEQSVLEINNNTTRIAIDSASGFVLPAVEVDANNRAENGTALAMNDEEISYFDDDVDADQTLLKESKF